MATVQPQFPLEGQGVRVALDNAHHDAPQLTALVEKVTGEGAVSLRCMDSREVSHYGAGTQVVLEYFRGGIVYKLYATVYMLEDEIVSEGGAVRMRLGAPREIVKIQRRRFGRAMLSVTITLAKVDLPADYDAESPAGKAFLRRAQDALQSNPATGLTETLSGSGLRMRSEMTLDLGAQVIVGIFLGERSVTALGNVVWKGAGPPQELPGTAYGIEFIDMPQDDFDNLLRFVSGYLPQGR